MTARVHCLLLSVCLAAMLPGCGERRTGPAAPAVAIRAENLTVTPSTGPVTHVLVHNPGATPYRGTVTATFPDTWKMNVTRHDVAIQPRETARLAFAIERGADAASNTYPVRVAAVGGDGTEVVRSQTIACASAPYFNPTIDGRFEDWNDAIPVTFATGGKKTVIRTYWSRRRFSLLVVVEEDALKPLPENGGHAACDALQVAISPRDAETAASAADKARRYEFLLAATKTGGACFALMRPGERLSVATTDRPLAGRELADAQVNVVHRDGVTYYECAVPMKAMPEIRPDPGREFCFSVLVHDPDGTGLRDWGEAAGLWPWQRNRLAWCSWPGATWLADPPFDNKVEWGFCSSKH